MNIIIGLVFTQPGSWAKHLKQGCLNESEDVVIREGGPHQCRTPKLLKVVSVGHTGRAPPLSIVESR